MCAYVCAYVRKGDGVLREEYGEGVKIRALGNRENSILGGFSSDRVCQILLV